MRCWTASFGGGTLLLRFIEYILQTSSMLLAWRRFSFQKEKQPGSYLGADGPVFIHRFRLLWLLRYWPGEEPTFFTKRLMHTQDSIWKCYGIGNGWKTDLLSCDPSPDDTQTDTLIHQSDYENDQDDQSCYDDRHCRSIEGCAADYWGKSKKLAERGIWHLCCRIPALFSALLQLGWVRFSTYLPTQAQKRLSFCLKPL